MVRVSCGSHSVLCRLGFSPSLFRFHTRFGIPRSLANLCSRSRVELDWGTIFHRALTHATASTRLRGNLSGRVFGRSVSVRKRNKVSRRLCVRHLSDRQLHTNNVDDLARLFCDGIGGGRVCFFVANIKQGFPKSVLQCVRSNGMCRGLFFCFIHFCFPFPF